jgi:hypothetical protein
MRQKKLVILLFPLLFILLGLGAPAPDSPASMDNVLYAAKNSGGFNDCEYEYKGNTIRIFATNSTDPGVYFDRINKDVSNDKYFSFAIRGKLMRMGQWCFPVVQLYDEKDDDYTPSITKTSFTLNEQDFTTITVPLEGKIKHLYKVQFLLVTDKGSWDIEVKDPRLE